MFKKIFLTAGLLSAALSQADMRVVAQLDITRDTKTKHVDFDTVISEQHYSGLTTLYDGEAYKLSIKGIGISGDVATLEFLIEDAEDNCISSPTIGCTWDQQASVKIGAHKAGEVIEQVVLTVTVSRA
jgi:hypothetical protein